MKKTLKILFVLLAVALLYAALRGIPWKAFVATLGSMRPGWAIACLLCELLALAARAQRWNLLLSHKASPSFSVSFVAEAVGDVGNTFLPARAGEAMRTVMVARRLKLSMPFVIGTATTERVSDAVFASLLAFVAVLLVPATPAWLLAAAWLFSLLGVAVLLATMFLSLVNRYLVPFLRRLHVPERLNAGVEHLLHGVTLGAQSLFGHPYRTAGYMALTICLWLSDSAAVVFLAHSFGTALTLAEAALFLAALGLSSAIPSTPGYIGIYQFVAVSVLTPLGLTRVHSLAVVLVYQVSMILLQLSLGGIGWLWLNYRARANGQRARHRDVGLDESR